MKISFFEEFPTKENLEKINLIKFPTKLYIASKSVEDFKKIKIDSEYIKEKIYWPVLERNDGYWLSPWSRRKALLKTIEDISNSNLDIMWDAEFPKTKSLLLKEMPNFFRNKSSINKFFRDYNRRIYSTEYLFETGFVKSLLQFFCLSFNPIKYNNTMIKMAYTSMHNYSRDFLKKEIEFFVEKYKNKFSIGLGVIAPGILGNEPILSPEQLEEDLKLCKDVNEVIIFRLGGLNKEYVKRMENLL